ncbi:MAG: hypothetical protein ABS46_02245 [Cytophagaceae bacterium SCN 52-12]|nr:MAG: hypothetical protein ABS46_02245 [Cytophagaceae bacterium SCN 52-12]
MKWVHFFALIAWLGLAGCSASTDTSLPANDFVEKLENSESAQLLDVRSPAEFAGGHLQDAVNINWDDPGFASKVKELDKTKPVFVYCLSGVRSISAADFLRKEGFPEVYELEGGMIKGGQALEMKSDQPRSTGMTLAEYQERIRSGKIVLVDFYADWCAPCKQMEPYINKIATDLKETVEVVRIDADQHPDLCARLGVDALPTIKIYRNNVLTWNQVGYVSQEQLLERIK